MARLSESKNNTVSALHSPVLLGSLGLGFITFALPIFGRELGASALQIGGLFAVFSAVIALLRPIVGWSIDRAGRKLFFLASLICYAVSMGLFAMAEGIFWLLLGQVARGVGAALMWVSAYTIATELTGSDGRGVAVGRVDEAAAQGRLYGGGAGFLIMTTLPPDIGWPLTFTGYALMAACGAWLGYKAVPETRPSATLQEESARAFSTRLYKLMLIVFVVAVSTSMLGPLFLVFLQDRFTTEIGALVLATIPAGLVASYLPSRLGKLSDRFGRVHLMALGLAVSGTVSFLLPRLPGLPWLTLIWTVESLGWSIAGPAQEAMIADLTGRQVRGTGYGLYTFAGSLGATIGPLIGGLVYDSIGQAVPFYVNGIVLFVGAVSAVLLLRPDPAAATQAFDAA
jgi:MFS family permease